jgi:predicted outer membrane repeat protein
LISNCTFANNSAASGGALYFGIDRNVTLTNCVFEGNVATMSHGGAFAHEGGGYANVLSATDCQFVGNSAPSGAGGAVFTVAWGGVDTLIRCHFEGNSASIGGGYRTDRHVVSIEDCSFAGNVAIGADSGRGGGAIAMEAISQATIVGSTFSDNHANRGGAIDHYWYCSGVSVSACTFTGNRGVLSGGAIVARDYCAIEVMSCHFDGNTSPVGAAIHASGGASSGDAVHVTSTRFVHHDEAVSDESILGGSGLAIVSESSVFCDNAIAAAIGDVDFDASNCVVEFCTDANGDGEVDACACPGDLNGDFVTDGADLSIVLGYWGPVTNPNNPADLNDDGLVDGADLAVMLGGWGACP